MKRLKALIVAVTLIVTTFCASVPVFGAQKIDNTLAVPPAFSTSQYALLNPAVAAQCGNNVTLMYNHYMSEGVRKGERLYATLTPTPIEKLFLYMSYNRADYVKKGLNATYPYFNLNNYIALNQDLVKVYGVNMPLYLYHYVNFGIYEGRPSGSLTDPAKVITWNPALAEFGNAKLSPAKIISNYTSVTGQISTASLSVPKKTAQPASASSVTPSSKHEHDWKYESIDDDKHWKECRNCDEKYKEDHHYHLYAQTDGSDATRHVLKCSKCDHKYAQKHYDKKGNGKCDECGYPMSGHIHNYIPQAAGATATYHVSKCACGAAKNEQHSLQYIYNGGQLFTHTINCKKCGYTISTADACDMNGLGASCSKCGHIRGVIPHTCVYTANYTPNNDGTHKAYCTCGEYQTQDCDHSGEGGKCSKCDYVWPAPAHSHAWGNWISNDDGTHSRTCSAANCPVGTETEDCNHNGNGNTCSDCGYSWPCSHTNLSWNYIGGDEHSITCDDCGASLGSEGCEYDSEDTCGKCTHHRE